MNELNALEERKKKLDIELKYLESRMNNSVNEMKSELIEKISPAVWIKKNPVKSVTIALVAGFLLAGKRNKKRNNKNVTQNAVRHSTGLGSLVGYELKRMLTQKATSYIVGYLDQFVEQKLRNPKKNELD